MKPKVHVAIFPSYGLGDGLIQLVLANNLRLNGYEVSYYHDYVAQLSDYVEGMTVCRIPSYESLFETLSPAHLILYDSKSPFTVRLPAQTAAWLASEGICYSMTRSAPVHTLLTAAGVQRRLPVEKRYLAGKFIKLNRSLRDTGLSWRRRPIAQQLADHIGRLLTLETRTCSSGLEFPTSPAAGRAGRVVAIHPTSGRESKSWRAEGFVELAHRIKRDGWRPAFTVSAAERPRWLDIGAGIDVPLFETIRQLADYYTRVAGFIGNDSGNAHLASCVGVPNLVIYRHWRRYPPWRPGWVAPCVVFPRSVSVQIGRTAFRWTASMRRFDA